MVVENIRVKSCRIDEPHDKGKFQIVFAVDDKKANKALKAMVDDDWAENKPKGANKPDNMAYFKSKASDEYPADDDTGSTLFLASIKAEITLRSGKVKEQRPSVFNGNGEEYEDDAMPNVGAGTIGNLIVTPYTYDASGNRGTKLNFQKLQITDLVEYSGGESFGNEKKKKKKKFTEDDSEKGNEKKKDKKKKKKNK